jgi:hypothetical protein
MRQGVLTFRNAPVSGRDPQGPAAFVRRHPIKNERRRTVQHMFRETDAHAIAMASTESAEASGGDDDAAFTAAVAAALTKMAARSPRHQADLIAALRGAGLPLDRPRIEAALNRLVSDGIVTTTLVLSDGGMLVTVAPVAPDTGRVWRTPAYA